MKNITRIFILSIIYNVAYAADIYSVTPYENSINAERTIETKIDVRKPTGNIEKFWNNLNWNDLSVDEQNLWGILGWNAGLWNSDSKVPVSDNKSWNDLSDEERSAATYLGYNQKLWDKN